MSTNHTPGPWEIQDPLEDNLCIVQAGKEPYDWQFIAIIPVEKGDDEIPVLQAEANAKLIAAAPDLLSSLVALLNDFDKGLLCGDIVKTARSAVKKAKGGAA